MVESQSRTARTTRENEETKARTFNSKVANGNIWVEVRGIRGQGQSEVLLPGDIYSKTGRPVMDVPRNKHPAMRKQDLVEPECSYFEDDPDVVPLDISEEDVMWVSGNLFGASGPSWTEVMAFQSWLLCFVQALAIIKEEMAVWTDWLSNKSPPLSAYRAIVSMRLVSLEKSQGVRTVEIREVCHHLFAMIVHEQEGCSRRRRTGV